MDSKKIAYQIKRVKDISFFINESLYVPDKKVKIDLNQSFGANWEKKLVNLTLIVQMRYDKAPINEILASVEVQNIFEVPELHSFSKGGIDMELPFDLLLSMVSISLSHGRALLAKNTSGSMFQDTIMPIMNPIDVTQHFFKVIPNTTNVEFKSADPKESVTISTEAKE